MTANVDCHPEVAAAIEHAESVERKAAVWNLVLSAADAQSRLGVVEACFFASVCVNLILIAAVTALVLRLY
jgi:hypothetical protein